MGLELRFELCEWVHRGDVIRGSISVNLSILIYTCRENGRKKQGLEVSVPSDFFLHVIPFHSIKNGARPPARYSFTVLGVRLFICNKVYL